MAKRKYIKLPCHILDNPNIGTLPDKEWREYITSLFNDPANVHYEAPPLRLEFLRKRSKLKRLLFERDEHKCRFCGSTKQLEIDHIIPLARGGENKLENLQILCRKCNRTKGAKHNGK